MGGGFTGGPNEPNEAQRATTGDPSSSSSSKPSGSRPARIESDLTDEDFDDEVEELSKEWPELRMSQVSDALKLFDETDADSNGALDQKEFSQLLRKVVPDLLSKSNYFDR